MVLSHEAETDRAAIVFPPTFYAGYPTHEAARLKERLEGELQISVSLMETQLEVIKTAFQHSQRGSGKGADTYLISRVARMLDPEERSPFFMNTVISAEYSRAVLDLQAAEKYRARVFIVVLQMYRCHEDYRHIGSFIEELRSRAGEAIFIVTGSVLRVFSRHQLEVIRSMMPPYVEICLGDLEVMAALGRTGPDCKKPSPISYRGFDRAWYLNALAYNEIVSVEASSGCRYHCHFCSLWRIDRYRVHALPEVIKQIATLRAEGFTTVRFLDNMLPQDEAYLQGLAEGIVNCCEDMRWVGCMHPSTRISANTARKIKRSGCEAIWIGVESGSESVREAMGKQYESSNCEELLATLAGEGIDVGAYLIGDFPGESLKDIEQTLEFVNRSRASIADLIVQRLFIATGSLMEREWYKWKDIVRQDALRCSYEGPREGTEKLVELARAIGGQRGGCNGHGILHGMPVITEI